MRKMSIFQGQGIERRLFRIKEREKRESVFAYEKMDEKDVYVLRTRLGKRPGLTSRTRVSKASASYQGQNQGRVCLPLR